MGKFIWKVKTRVIGKKDPQWLTKILAQNRGLTSAPKLADFLNPALDQILAVKLSGVEKGVERTIAAVKNKQKIIVYSDYDADGICATAIMWETLYDLGANVMPYVPHRIKEGYGLSKETISQLAKKKTQLIITVDHGVTAVEQVKYAKSLGIDVVITDHHVLPQKLPLPYALIHSLDLCGAGVSWRFCWEIIQKLNPQYQERLIEKLELAALATIADLVPLLGANRAIVKIGLEKLARTRRPGIKALIKNAGIAGSVGTYEIGHILAPRINAMGRIEHGINSLRLLCAKNQNQADQLAKLLSKTNTRRQDLTVAAVTHAHDLVDKQMLVGVVFHQSWHEGVIGLVASRLVEAYHKPMVVISKGEVYSKGSARSIAGFNIVEAIRASSDLLVDGGGHPMAAGFTIETRHIGIFAQKINEYAQKKITAEILSPQLEIECELKKEDISQKSLRIIKQFEPYGVGNPEPLFLTKNMLVEDVRTVGAANGHLKLQVDGFSAIGFNMGQFQAKIRPGYLVDLAYTIDIDDYNGFEKLQLKVRDIRVS